MQLPQGRQLLRVVEEVQREVHERGRRRGLRSVPVEHTRAGAPPACGDRGAAQTIVGCRAPARRLARCSSVLATPRTCLSRLRTAARRFTWPSTTFDHVGEWRLECRQPRIGIKLSAFTAVRPSGAPACISTRRRDKTRCSGVADRAPVSSVLTDVAGVLAIARQIAAGDHVVARAALGEQPAALREELRVQRRQEVERLVGVRTVSYVGSIGARATTMRPPAVRRSGRGRGAAPVRRRRSRGWTWLLLNESCGEVWRVGGPLWAGRGERGRVRRLKKSAAPAQGNPEKPCTGTADPLPPRPPAGSAGGVGMVRSTSVVAGTSAAGSAAELSGFGRILESAVVVESGLMAVETRSK